MSTTPAGEAQATGLSGRTPLAAGATRRGGRGVALCLVFSVAGVVLVTGAIGLLQRAVPVLSLSVLYLLAVLPVAAAFGLGYAIGVSLASMAAFNFFFLPPLHTLTLDDSGNWLALGIFVCTSVVVSELASRQRRRAREAEQREREAAMLAEIAAGLLAANDTATGLADVSRIVGEMLGVADARITLGSERPLARPGELVLALTAADRRVANLTAPSAAAFDTEVSERFLPAVASMLAMAVDRDRLGHDAAEAEVLRRSDAVKTTVLRAVSHDLRSPLTAIIVASDTLAEGPTALSEQDRVDLVETVCAEARRLERTVGNLLDLSRLQAGVAVRDAELWTADALVEQALSELGDVGSSVRVDLPPDLPAVLVDAGQIRRALVNLLANAVGVTPPGQCVGIRGVVTSDEVQLHITDDGAGVDPREAAVIFEAFRRGAAAGRGGVGLGLAIVRGFAEANGGRVWVESPAEGGACFVLALPLAPEPRG